MRLLLSVASLAPAYGGPARSVSRLALALAENGLQVALWAPDGSARSSSLIQSHENLTLLDGSIRGALESWGRVDLLHDNGIWLRHNHDIATLCRKLGIPRVVSLRGMIEPWAMNHKRWKKRIAWAAYQRHDLATADLHHVTSEREAGNRERYGWRTPALLLPNGVDVPARYKVPQSDSATRTALFVGRIYPVKGLPLLVEAWARLRPEGWKLRIVGPDEGGHQRVLSAMVRRFCLEDEVAFSGSLEGTELALAYESADLFVLPSYTENFGMAAAEALSYGLPVIASQGTPWEVLGSERCGWWVPVSVEGMLSALTVATSLPSATLCEMGSRGRRLVAERFSWQSVAHEFIAAYRKLLRG